MASSQELVRDGYPSHGLTMMFHDHSCCHLGEDEMDAVAQEIVRRIVESGGLASMPPAEARER